MSVAMIIEDVVVDGRVLCDGCRKPIVVGERIGRESSSLLQRSYWHRQCATESALKLGDACRPPEQRGQVRVGATRERLTQLRARVELGAMDADTMRAVMLALIDEVMK